jgi:hypothetical protein
LIKETVILLAILTSSFVHASTKTFDVAFKHKLYYSSYIFLQNNIEKNVRVDKRKINRVLDSIHPSVFIHDSKLDKFINKSKYLNYPVGLRQFFLNNFSVAKTKLSKVKKRSPLFVESNYVLGLIALSAGKGNVAIKHFKRCVRYADRKKRTGIKTEAYIKTFKNRCIQQVARINFTQKKYNTSLKILNYVKKTDYLWPRFLLDKAWSYYWTGQNERALGSVITYKAPIMQRFMMPEANYLRALIYYEMCYFEKSEYIYKEFKKNTWKYRKLVKSASRNNLLKLISTKRIPKSASNKFLYFYLKGYKKDIRYFSYKHARKQINKEIRKLSKIKKLKIAKDFLETLYFYKHAIKEDFLDFLKRLATDYYAQIIQTRRHFAKLDLMISLKKRKNIRNKKSELEKNKFLTMDLGAIPDINEKYIWDFQGGFWADELGDYAVALENRCHNEN